MHAYMHAKQTYTSKEKHPQHFDKSTCQGVGACVFGARISMVEAEEMYTYIHTSIRTYIHKYTHPYVHTYIYTYVHTYILANVNTRMLAFMHTYIQSHIHT